MGNFNLDILIRDNIKTMKSYSSARDEFKDMNNDMVFLDANENPFESSVNRYPDPQQIKVKSLISESRNIPIHQILLGNGSDEILDLIFRAFCEPNRDNIVTLPPTYGMYEVLANLNAINVLKVELDSHFEPKVDEILKTQNSNSKLLFLCSPNNPTANCFDNKKIEQLIFGFNGIVVIDEAYIDFSENESWMSKINKFQNLIVTQTLSKAYGMAGIRLGLCFASEAIISILNKIKPPYNINQLTQLKALEQLSNPKKKLEEIDQILQQREWLFSEFYNISFIQNIYSSDANFLLVKVDNANKRYAQLIEKGIVVRNRTNQALCENCLRFTVGTELENIKLIKALQDIT